MICSLLPKFLRNFFSKMTNYKNLILKIFKPIFSPSCESTFWRVFYNKSVGANISSIFCDFCVLFCCFVVNYTFCWRFPIFKNIFQCTELQSRRRYTKLEDKILQERRLKRMRTKWSKSCFCKNLLEETSSNTILKYLSEIMPGNGK